jgi:hypothetical protein
VPLSNTNAGGWKKQNHSQSDNLLDFSEAVDEEWEVLAAVLAELAGVAMTWALSFFSFIGVQLPSS